MRTEELFNEDWLFCRFGAMPNGEYLAEPTSLECLTLDASLWQEVTLPHDWAIAGPFRQELDGSTGKLPWAGIGWYRKQFVLDIEDKNKRIFIDIDGAMSNSTVWINEKKVGGWPYGYNSYRVEITSVAEFGKINTIAIRLDNSPASSRWYPGGGIYRNVHLVKTAPVHVAHWGTFVRSTNVSHKHAELELDVTVDNQSDTPCRINLINQIYYNDELKQEFPEQQLDLLPHSSSAVNITTFVKNPLLWDTENPNLYTLKTKIITDTQVVDEYTTEFGIRSIEYHTKHGFLLNGKVKKFNGVCEHHDLGPLGAVINERGIERKIELLKELGCNAIRTSHNMPAPELLKLCDRMGMLVQAESFDCWEIGKRENDYHQFFSEWHEKDLVSFIHRDRNHPCIVMWSCGNELREQNLPRGIEIANQLREIFHREDPTRPVSAGCSSPESGFNGFQNCFDVFGFNYKPHLYADFIKSNPSLPFYGSETSSCVSSRGEYFFPVEDNKARGVCLESFQVSSYDLSAPPWAYKPDIEFAAQDKYPSIMGEFVWTGFDYLGEPTPYNDDLTNLLNAATDEDREEIQKALGALKGKKAPSRSSYFGIFDLCGFKKDRFYLYQAKWRPDFPMAHILPHWNWPERVGRVTPVHVYTSGDEVELFLNEKSLGRKKRGKYEYRLCWNEVVYEPGKLHAVAYKNGKLWAEDHVTTTGNVAKAILEADRSEILADGKDISYVTVRLCDADNMTDPRSSELITFELNGPGEIIAVANGDATDHTPFSAKSCKAFNGLCQVIIRSLKAQAGKITLIAKMENLPQGESVKLTVTSSAG